MFCKCCYFLVNTALFVVIGFDFLLKNKHHFELIHDNEVNFDDDYCLNQYKSKTKYEGIVNIIGKDLLSKLQKTKPFVVGSGAIGCELIKLLGMLGLKDIYLTRYLLTL